MEPVAGTSTMACGSNTKADGPTLRRLMMGMRLEAPLIMGPLSRASHPAGMYDIQPAACAAPFS